MKRYFLLFTILCLCLISCRPSIKKEPLIREPDEPSPNQTDSRLENLLLIDGAGETSLLFADNGTDNLGAIYTADIHEKVSVRIDGRSATTANLKDGMILSIWYTGPIAESYPMQIMDITAIEATTVAKENYPDLCGFYLKLLDDLWQEDTALNGKTVGFDFTNLPGNLSPASQSALALRFGEHHNVQTVLGTMDSLKKDGYITDEGWKDGCLITISSGTDANTKSETGILTFNVTKWSSPKGAIFWRDCHARWEENGVFPEYQIGGKAISRVRLYPSALR